MKVMFVGNESERIIVDICKGYAEIGTGCQSIIDVLIENGGRFEGGYSDLARVINVLPTNVRKYILRVSEYGIFKVELGKTSTMTPMRAIELSDDWIFKLAELGQSGKHKRWH